MDKTLSFIVPRLAKTFINKSIGVMRLLCRFIKQEEKFIKIHSEYVQRG